MMWFLESLLNYLMPTTPPKKISCDLRGCEKCGGLDQSESRKKVRSEFLLDFCPFQ